MTGKRRDDGRVEITFPRVFWGAMGFCGMVASGLVVAAVLWAMSVKDDLAIIKTTLAYHEREIERLREGRP